MRNQMEQKLIHAQSIVGEFRPMPIGSYINAFARSLLSNRVTPDPVSSNHTLARLQSLNILRANSLNMVHGIALAHSTK